MYTVLTLNFEMTEYEVDEGSGITDGLVFISKDIESELDLQVRITANDGTAMNGQF